VHSDGNATNPNSIKQAFNFSDVAQLNYHNRALWSYMDKMLVYWVSTYHVDGFRFDTADDPDGPGRMIPAAFWAQLGGQLRGADPGIIMLGECDTPDLANKPFQLEYDWDVYHALSSVEGGGAQVLETTWNQQTRRFPPGMLFMNITQDWDTAFDQYVFNGPAGVNQVLTFNFLSTGVPLIYNGEEVGNVTAGTNPHSKIVWNGGGGPAWTTYYSELIALREANPALQIGKMTWLPTSSPNQVVAFTRSYKGTEFLIVMNFSLRPALGHVYGKQLSGWKCVWPKLRAGRSANPLNYSMLAQDYGVFERKS
jgi:glycosidase